MEINRNQYCPCGSKKKYKNCCEFSDSEKRAKNRSIVDAKAGLKKAWNDLSQLFKGGKLK